MFKRIMLAILVIGLLFTMTSCKTLFCGVKESQFLEHNSQYKNCAHMRFSIWGYNNPTADHHQKSESQGWWGCQVPVK